MKKLLIASALGLAMANAQAAIVTGTVTGGLTIAVQNQFAPVAPGVNPFIESIQGGDSAIMNFTGSITYDDVTGAISALSLTQVGSSGILTPNAGSLTNPNPFSDGTQVEYSNFSYTYDPTGSVNGGPALLQSSASVNCIQGCGLATDVYANWVIEGDGINPFGIGLDAQGNPNPTFQTGFLRGSIFNFDGVYSGALPNAFPAFLGDTFTTGAGFIAIPQADGVTGVTVNGNELAITLQGTTGDNQLAFHQGNYGFLNLTVTPVPVPAAAWLFGSALLGLASVARRRA